jgi:hypothetical protein
MKLKNKYQLKKLKFIELTNKTSWYGLW